MDSMDIPEHHEHKKRPETYPADELHEHYEQNPDLLRLEGKKRRVVLPDGKRVRISMPLLVFIKKGTACIECGIKGTIYQAFEAPGKQGYVKLNLYAQRVDGSWVLMTADHTIPRSAGGGNFLDNLEPMCMDCNYTKGSTLPDNFVPEDMQISLKSVKDRILTENRGKDVSRYLKFHRQLMRRRRAKGATIPGIVTKKYAKAYIKLIEGPYNLTIPKSLKKMGLSS